MSSSVRSASFDTTTSPVRGSHLSPSEQTAYQQGFDAGLRSIGALSQHLQSFESLTTVTSQASREEVEDRPRGQDPIRSEATLVSGEPGLIDQKLEKVDLEQADPEKAAGAPPPTEADPNIVGWDGPDDPENPLNWTGKRKAGIIAILSFLTFLTPLASSFFAPAVPMLMRDFKETNQLLATFVVSVYILGFAFGPLIIAPASELYGRAIVYNVTNVGFIILTIACALAPNMSTLVAFRFFQGCFGVTPVTIGGGTLADIMPPEKRGAAMAIWAMGPMLGPVIGPIAGGFLSTAEGWRWIFWVAAIVAGLATVIAFFVLRETYAPVLLQRKTERLQKETGNYNLRSKLDNRISPKQLYIRTFVRPAKLMFLSPICSLMSVYMAIVYGLLYILFTTFTFVFQSQYHFSTIAVGLVYLAMGVGQFIGLGLSGSQSDKISKKLTAKNGGVMKPEYRLPLLVYLGPTIPVGLFIYGWTIEYKVHYIVPMIATGIIGIGMIIVMIAINTYLVDTFGLYAASAMAANTVLRSALGALFPLFGLKMNFAIGYGWANTTLGLLSAALCPIPLLFYIYGERIRTSPRFQVKL